ncbi:MAG: sensor histidine kinase, partial [Deltaproteobacteria bacterium]
NAADEIESSANRDGILFITTTSENKKILSIVRDTGPGIPDGNYEKLFKPFFTTKAVGKGTGLGLSISRNIIEEHNGTITVQNHSDGGAEFRITLPVASATL